MYNKMYNKIINPENGKKVSINSKLGRKIIKKYMKFVGGAFSSKTPTKSLNIVVSDSSPNGSRFAQHVFQNVHKNDLKSTFEQLRMTLNLPGKSYKLDIQHLPALNTLLGRITEETNIIILPLVNPSDSRSEYVKLTKLINEANSVAPNALIIIATDRTNNNTSVTRAVSNAGDIFNRDGEFTHHGESVNDSIIRMIVNSHDELISKRQLVFLDYNLDLDGREIGRILDSYNVMSSRVEFAKAQYGPISKLLGVASSAASSAASYAKNMWSRR